MIVFEIFAISLIGAFIALDRVAIFQVMISRPIVAAPLIALILGDPMIGIKVGIILELLWIHFLPIGASVPPDETIVSVLVTAITIWCMSFFETDGNAIISLALILVIPTAIFAQKMDSFVRKKNIESAHAADLAIEKLDLKKLTQECLRGIKRFYFSYVLIFFSILTVSLSAVYLIYPLLPDFALTGLNRFYYLLPLIGIASVLSMSRIKNTPAVLLASFIVFFGLFEVVG